MTAPTAPVALMAAAVPAQEQQAKLIVVVPVESPAAQLAAVQEAMEPAMAAQPDVVVARAVARVPDVAGYWQAGALAADAEAWRADRVLAAAMRRRIRVQRVAAGHSRGDTTAHTAAADSSPDRDKPAPRHLR